MPARMAVGFIYRFIMDRLPGEENRITRLKIDMLLGDETAKEELEKDRRRNAAEGDFEVG